MTDGGKKKENNGGEEKEKHTVMSVVPTRYPMGPTIIRYGPFWAAV